MHMHTCMQGHVLGHCVDEMLVVDMGGGRQKYATRAQLNGSHGVLIAHPNKRGVLKEWREVFAAASARVA